MHAVRRHVERRRLQHTGAAGSRRFHSCRSILDLALRSLTVSAAVASLASDRGERGKGAEIWSALEIRLLTAFVAVVEHQSFTGAARHLGYTQSGVSHQVAALERIVGRRLLVREFHGRRPIEPTPVGRTFLEHCRNLLSQLEDAYVDVVGCELTAGVTVGVASIPSVAVRLIPTLESAAREKAAIRILLHEALVDEHLFRHLDERHATFAFTTLPVPSRFTFTEVGHDHYVAVVAATSRLAGVGVVGARQLRGVPLLGVRRSAHEALV